MKTTLQFVIFTILIFINSVCNATVDFIVGAGPDGVPPERNGYANFQYSGSSNNLVFYRSTRPDWSSFTVA